MSTCPHCGELIEDDAESCPHCGSDYETGWNPEADYLSLDLPSFDDDDDDTYSDPYSFGAASSAGQSSTSSSSSWSSVVRPAPATPGWRRAWPRRRRSL